MLYEIRNLDASIFENMLVSDASEEQLELETEVVDKYVSKFYLKNKQMHFIKGTLLKLIAKALTRLPIRSQRFKLPKTEVQKYAGDLEGWFEFWKLFKKIHEDTGIDNEEKIQYFIQSTKAGSRAHKCYQKKIIR
ncbi:unnamed protein product [Psylliodes chrysocephalus]|uniref:Uncharacterized protein n=1 Tax=Psylliodes chrysocephalus TaxID=3402493 RepID=A0A9P0GDB6_9CUCU|nr:unnamed protein product [Psylliodes chrysocephala]